MVTQDTEVKNGLVWTLKCRDCEANICGNGFKSLPLAEMFITEHAAEMGHTDFNMNVYGFSIVIQSITDEKPEAV